MSQKTIYESDLSGKGDAKETHFGFGNSWFEIDLTLDEQTELKALLEPYFEAGRRVLSAQTARRRQVPETTTDEREAIRAWAQSNGFDFALRGRIPKRIMSAYDKTHGVNRSA